MNRFLIVNADDCNLTSGVTHAILDCHDRGIVTSTSFLINLPIQQADIPMLKRRKRLGIGLHLNITLGEPVSQAKSVRSLVYSNHRFKRDIRTQHAASIKSGHVMLEYENQIKMFKKVFGRKPTHLDTHHQLHDHALYFRILKKIAKRHRLPMRRSRLMRSTPSRYVVSPRATHYLFGDLNPSRYWNRSKLMQVLKKLPDGVSEIMCHPGRNDDDLKKMSSFRRGRTTEWRIFRCRGLKKQVKTLSIKLCHYGML